MAEDEVLGFQEDIVKDDTPSEDTDDSDEKELGEGEDEFKPEHGEGSKDDVLEYTGDKEDEEEEVVEKKGKVEEKKEVEEEKKDLSEEEKAKEDIISFLSEEEGGTKYRIKGKEYDLRDLSPQEVRDRFSKAGRFYERMEELAAKEKLITERERLAEDGARKSQEILRKYGDTSGRTDEAKVPDILKPDADDTEEVAALKQTSIGLMNRLDRLEKVTEEQTFSVSEQQLYRQLDALVEEFPMASKEQIIAVKYNYPDADMRQIAENSHNERMNDAYLEAVFKARPDKLRELEEKAVEKHLAKKTQAGKVSRKKSSSTTSGKVTSGKTKIPRTFDEIEERMDEVRGAASSADWD